MARPRRSTAIPFDRLRALSEVEALAVAFLASRAGEAVKQLATTSHSPLAVPFQDGTPFCAFGDASGFRHDTTKLKDHTFVAEIWGSSSWDHWPVGWVNSQGHTVDAESLKLYPNHFSTMGMDFFALPNEVVEAGIYYSLLGVAGHNLEEARSVARRWLEKGEAETCDPTSVSGFPPVFHP